MNNSATVFLIVLLSVGFVILLTLSIILVLLMIGIMRNLRNITDHADKATQSASDILSMLGKKIAPVAISTAVAAALRQIRKKE
jgi:predicted HAD superfamily phosphohydrolase